MFLHRRRRPREIIPLDVYVDLFPNNAGWLSSISEGGLALALHPFFPLVSGHAILIGFDLPGTNNRIEANCQIAWTDKVRQRTGLRFLELPEASRQLIRKWLFVRIWKRRLVRLFVGAVVLCGLTFLFVYMLGK
jgi:hypothetical protein